MRDEGVLAAVEAAEGAAQAEQHGHRRGAEREAVVLGEGPLLTLALLHHAHQGLQQIDLSKFFKARNQANFSFDYANVIQPELR